MEKNYSDVGLINEFKGEFANEYETRWEYVEQGGWERDYFEDWLRSCSDYPYLDEIEDFCGNLRHLRDKWFEGVEAGVIDSEAGWED